MRRRRTGWTASATAATAATTTAMVAAAATTTAMVAAALAVARGRPRRALRWW